MKLFDNYRNQVLSLHRVTIIMVHVAVYQSVSVAPFVISHPPRPLERASNTLLEERFPSFHTCQAGAFPWSLFTSILLSWILKQRDASKCRRAIIARSCTRKGYGYLLTSSRVSRDERTYTVQKFNRD